MRRRDILRSASAAFAIPALPRLAVAQGSAWVPDRPITMITGYGPGGSTDIAARMLADRMATALGPEARIVVDNKPGAAGTIATEWLKRQPADGYTIMVTETGAAAAAPATTIGGTRYDPVADFTQLGVISTPPGVLVVTPSFAGPNPHQVLTAMREAPPEKLTYASSGFGGVLHMRAEMLAQALGTRFVHVPYRSGAQMVQAIMTGEAQFGVAALASATPLMREGKVRGVAMVGTRRFPTFPDIPTLGELGVSGFENSGFFLLIGPANIPPRPAEALNRALVTALHDPVIRERMIFAGHDPVQGANGLAEARAFMVRELAEMKKIVERTGIRVQP
ncbi:ABC transporter substrate-binding protein [Siccirubricoccus deserti]|uniref:Tripartite tricarboxylate transporter substrate binding protein n=1 Tax=Siccirubricoccus deserti TaxID=2013562 RepID=A0A9X0R1X6_9PROT|nr:tripartite tricarboxylate transporter substrate binding protein [Siccirubricoccus deserti]MBC4016938.1 tripartite tricarboxylate transporter substrate binding protein [Siccirubricoccus deserti]GGC53924.1 ABC transporter substrate-binding protein [Siccirubricoccus deserti]